jgi:hypothetical protein
VVSLRTADVRALESAFEAYEELPPTCSVVVVSGSGHGAFVKATGTSWALATLEPSPSCVIPFTGGRGPPGTYDPATYGPFAADSHPIGVFQRLPDESWTMNSGEGTLLCTKPDGLAPGPGNGGLPDAVLSA